MPGLHLAWLQALCAAESTAVLNGPSGEVQGTVAVQSPGLTRDGKPSVIVNYVDVENPVWRPLRDEVRRVISKTLKEFACSYSQGEIPTINLGQYSMRFKL